MEALCVDVSYCAQFYTYSDAFSTTVKQQVACTTPCERLVSVYFLFRVFLLQSNNLCYTITMPSMCADESYCAQFYTYSDAFSTTLKQQVACIIPCQWLPLLTIGQETQGKAI